MMTTLRFIIILIDDDKMILCRKENFDDMTESDRQRLIKKSFSRSILGLINMFGFKRKIQYKIEYSRSVYNPQNPQFDLPMYNIVSGNDWEKAPFMALLLYEKHGTPYFAVSASGS